MVFNTYIMKRLFVVSVLCNPLLTKAQEGVQPLVSTVIDNPNNLHKKTVQYVNLLYEGVDTQHIFLQIRLLNGSRELFEGSVGDTLYSGKVIYPVEWKRSGFKSKSFYELYTQYALFPVSDKLYYELWTSYLC